MPDVSDQVRADGGRVRLPFDLAEVATNLRRERYVQSQDSVEAITSAPVAHSLYYFLRPFLPVGLRKYLQRIRLSGWDRIPFPRWPVDATVDELMQKAMTLALQSSGVESIPFIWFWPEGAPACVMMTHDVEREEGADFTERLMDLDDSFGIKSAFQIVPEPRATSNRLLARLRSRGFEVNVHDWNHDGSLFRDKRRFLERAELINGHIRQFGSGGFRSGAMYRNQEWFEAFSFSYDMSVPCVAHLEPQRGGCCTVLPYFVGDLLELPLTTTQDYSLFHILGDYSTRLWDEQIEGILAKNGLASFIVHPDYLSDTRAEAVYTALLSRLSELRDDRRVWVALPGEVNSWWRSRRAMTLVKHGLQWRVEGPGAERARVALASLDGNRLVYKVCEPVCAAGSHGC